MPPFRLAIFITILAFVVPTGAGPEPETSTQPLVEAVKVLIVALPSAAFPASRDRISSVKLNLSAVLGMFTQPRNPYDLPAITLVTTCPI